MAHWGIKRYRPVIQCTPFGCFVLNAAEGTISDIILPKYGECIGDNVLWLSRGSFGFVADCVTMDDQYWASHCLLYTALLSQQGNTPAILSMCGKPNTNTIISPNLALSSITVYIAFQSAPMTSSARFWFLAWRPQCRPGCNLPMGDSILRLQIHASVQTNPPIYDLHGLQ